MIYFLNYEIYNELLKMISITGDLFYDLVLMAFVDRLSYRYAFAIVGDLGFRGIVGSLAHYSIRFILVYITAKILYLFFLVYKIKYLN